jgi:hypothetical protein
MTRIAICVGQDVYAPDSGVPPLRGGVNDARLIGALLAHAGFTIRRIEGPAATQAGILGALRTAVAGLHAGDQLVFWNASHGYQVTDQSADETDDHLDEAICCYDNDPDDPLNDDKFAAVLGPTDPSADIVFASDSCHSGTLTRLAAVQRNVQARLWIPPQAPAARAGAQVTAAPVGRLGQLTAAPHINHLLLTACRPAELSWGALYPPGFHGALTYGFATAVQDAWSAGMPVTYREAFDRATTQVLTRFDQHPPSRDQTGSRTRRCSDTRPGRRPRWLRLPEARTTSRRPCIGSGVSASGTSSSRCACQLTRSAR